MRTKLLMMMRMINRHSDAVDWHKNLLLETMQKSERRERGKKRRGEMKERRLLPHQACLPLNVNGSQDCVIAL